MLGDAVVFATIGTDVDREVVFGQALFRNISDTAVTLDEARILGDVPAWAAEVVQTRVKDMDEFGPDFVGAAEWPFEDYGDVSKPLAGHNVPAGGTVELLFVVAVREPGDWRWPRTEVRYVAEGDEYLVRSDNGFGICAPSTRRCSVEP